jgi:hypothetical protein
MNSARLRLFVLMATAPVACADGTATRDVAAPVPAPIEPRTSLLTGTSSYIGCSAQQVTFLEKVARNGRIVSNSPAFQACVRNLHVGTPGFAFPYMPQCSPADRAANETAAVQVSTLLPLTRRGTPMRQTCGGTCGDGANACAGWSEEEFTWAGWLDAVLNASDPANPAWPISQAAGLMWHEVMHTYAYFHPACAQPGYDLDFNTVPNIVEMCMEGIMNASGLACGSPTSCGADALPIVTTPVWGPTTCQCVKDPRSFGHDIVLTGAAGWTSLPTLVANPDGTFTMRDYGVANFPTWAANPTAWPPLAGDFNGDGRTDLALVGGGGWTTLPLALGDTAGDGTYRIKNEPISGFQSWAAQSGVQKYVGDFNGDGRSDLAMLGGTGWNTIPVARANATEGTFTVTNSQVPGFAALVQQANNKVLKGDFNGDGRTDFAATGQATWTGIPMAFASAAGDGSFFETNTPVGGFAQLASLSSAHAGDFNGDGKSDIALLRNPNWSTVPVAVSQGDGSFTTYNPSAAGFADASNAPGARTIVADFIGDGKSDIALIGGQGWTTIPVLFSTGAGTWTTTNSGVDSFPVLAQNPDARHIVADFNRDGLMDLALVGVAGWTTLPIAYSNGDGTFSFANPSVGTFGAKSATAGAVPFTGNFRL